MLQRLLFVVSPYNLPALVRQDWIAIVKQIHSNESHIPKVNPQSLNYEDLHSEAKEVSVSYISRKLKLVHQGNQVFAVGELCVRVRHLRKRCRRTL